MGNVVFYKDSIDDFECEITIEGASTNSSKARLVLEFSDKTLLFNGEIRDGHVSVQVPKLLDISEVNGNATLEIIADQTFFEAWQSPFELKNKKSVSIDEVRINDKNSPKVVIENVSKEKSSVSASPKKPGIYKDTCSEKNKRFVKESFKRFNSLDQGKRDSVKSVLREFEAKPMVETWAKSVFNDIDTPYAKYIMYELQKGKK